MRKYNYPIHKKHYLKHPSSFIVVVLKSLMHKACVNCGQPINSLEESSAHWEKALQNEKEKDKQYQLFKESNA